MPKLKRYTKKYKRRGSKRTVKGGSGIKTIKNKRISDLMNSRQIKDFLIDNKIFKDVLLEKIQKTPKYEKYMTVSGRESIEALRELIKYIEENKNELFSKSEKKKIIPPTKIQEKDVSTKNQGQNTSKNIPLPSYTSYKVDLKNAINFMDINIDGNEYPLKRVKNDSKLPYTISFKGLKWGYNKI